MQNFPLSEELKIPMTSAASAGTRPRLRLTKDSRRAIRVAPLTANATLFIFGAAAWVFKLGNEKTGPLLPYSFSQVALPCIAILTLFLIVQVWQLYFPPIAIRGWFMRLLNIGIILIITGAIFHLIQGGDYELQVILYFVRWLLPWS